MDLNEFRKELKSLKKISPIGADTKAPLLGQNASDSLTDQAPSVGNVGNGEWDVDSYCQRMSASRNEVWQKVKRGELLAKHADGKLWIIDPNMMPSSHRPIPSGSKTVRRAAATAKADASPNQTNTSPNLPALSAASAGLSGGVFGRDNRDSVELALLIDHLSLAKDENREIIRMAQESLERISSMAEKVVAAKEMVLKEKEARIEEQSQLLSSQKDQIDLMKDRIKSQESDLLKLRRDIEDLEILTRSLSAEDELT